MKRERERESEKERETDRERGRERQRQRHRQKQRQRQTQRQTETERLRKGETGNCIGGGTGAWATLITTIALALFEQEQLFTGQCWPLPWVLWMVF